MKYQFEHEGIEACGDCPCCDSIGGCALGGSVESLGEVPDDCPLVAISKTETADCKWCNNADRMVVSVKTISDSSEWVGIKRFLTNKSHFCPNCGRQLEEK